MSLELTESSYNPSDYFLVIRIAANYLTPLVQKFAHSYVDDCFKSSASEDESAQLKLVEDLIGLLEVASDNNISFRMSKTALLVREITILGRKYSATGQTIKDEYLTDLLQTPRPRNQTEVRAFLGALHWISKFLPRLAEIVAPLW